MTERQVTIDEASSSAIIVKNAILARSGIYMYSHEEMLRRGHNPEVKKDFYREYRPASVLVAAKDKFKYAVLTKEHPNSITTDNIQQVIEGVVGSNIDVVSLGDNDIALKGEIAFYTKDGVDYYNAGVKETSAQYISKVTPVFGEDYDYILDEIQEVQGLALTRQGRGGSAVAVLDSLISAATAEKKLQGDKVMSKNSILSFLGIGKAPQDELSSLVIDSLTGYSGLNEIDKKARRDKVDTLLNSLADSPEKKILVDTVKDCFDYPKEVLEKSEEVTKGIKSLYTLCVSSEVANLQATFDSIKGEAKDTYEEEEEKKKKEAKEKEVKDAEAKEKETKDAEAKAKEEEEKKKKVAEGTKDSIVLDAKGLELIITKVTDSVSAKIEDVVRKQLGLEGKKGETNDSVLPSFSSVENDGSFLLKDMFS